MSARYRKIDPRFWRDEKVRRLSLEQKAIALYCITAQSNRIGIFNFSPAQAAEELGMRPRTFAKGSMKGFDGVCRTLKFKWDPEARVLYLPTWWKYNPPENPNVLKSCLADLHDIAETPLLIEFSENLSYLSETFHETFRQTLAKGWLKPSPNQEQEQEQEQDQEQEQEQEKPRARARSADDVLDWFESEFKPRYPSHRRVQEASALRKLRALRPNAEQRAQIIASLELWTASSDWTRDEGKYVPGMERFFSDKYYQRQPENRRDSPAVVGMDAVKQVLREIRSAG
ncbi:MAG TPA: hypothetical protein VNF29_05070 [Candidatus Binataceae bacterium]|nr:hypothetical protein [Candidatus Binataceae bacterium]